jgi:hypothetical protein
MFDTVCYLNKHKALGKEHMFMHLPALPGLCDSNPTMQI